MGFAVWACFLYAFLLISVLFSSPVFSHLRSEKRILPLSLQNRVKFKQNIDIETLEINELCIIDALVLLSVMGSL